MYLQKNVGVRDASSVNVNQHNWKTEIWTESEDLPPNLVANDGIGLGRVIEALDEQEEDEQQINDEECSSFAPV